KPDVFPYIGEPNQQVILTHTLFNPVTIEVEIVDHDFETLAYGLFGNQSKSLEDGIYTIYNFNNEIYEQYNLYELKSQFTGVPLYEIKEKLEPNNTIDGVDSEVIREIFTRGVTEEQGILGDRKKTNGYYILKNGKSSSLAFYNESEDTLERIEKEFVYGIKPKNAEQAFALHALLNPNIKLVAVQGVAGTGKTLLALAAALEQEKKFNQIILARPIVPLSNKEIGFLPGDANDKISPYMEPLWDNLKFIKSQYGENEKKHKAINEMELNKKIIITPLAFIRGRSFSNIMFIIDEAQNLTPHEIKTIITRAGENTKIIFTGDVQQIDTPYLDEYSNGLAYLIQKINGKSLFAHVKLEKGERSELANLANELL
ncbi:MAG: DUF2075 domain-containing protein, partial [Flavobacteriia bacterium]|nr:DUF2075 domain-containing protein [Flavobacteriia bacterium]